MPLHSHPSPATFVMLEGEAESLHWPEGGSPTWTLRRPGDVVDIPPGERHAWRNSSTEPFSGLIITDDELAAWFVEVGAPLAAGEQPELPPRPEIMGRVLEVSARHGLWMASPEENADVGIDLESV